MTLRSPEQIKADPIFEALNPHGKKFISARVLPPELTPFPSHQITAIALTLSGMPHSKAIPAHVMMWSDYVNDVYRDKHTLVVPSSGNTVHAVARLARAYGLKVKAVMSTDVPDSKTGILRAFGNAVDVLQVSNVVETTLEESGKLGHHHLDQYSHEGNPESHERYTGPEILRALSSHHLAAIAVPLGSGGTADGLARFFKEQSPETLVIGVRPRLGEQVPGARDKKKMSEVVKFQWEKRVRTVVEVSRKESFIAMRELWSAVEPQPGPTSGMAWKGLVTYLENLCSDDRDMLYGKTIAFFCPDDGRFYSALTLAELDPDQGIV